MTKQYWIGSASLAMLLFLASCSRILSVDDERLRVAATDSGNWLMYGRTYDDQRFSPLSQINERTVGKLGLAWSLEFGTSRGLEASSLVSEGVIYTSGSWSVVYAIDARNGEIRWSYDPQVPRARAMFICCDVVNRGVALYKGKVYVGTLDGRLIALDQHTGAPIWSISTADPDKPYAITAAPRIAKGMVIIGNAGSEFGVRGYVTAYDAETGKQRWRTFTVPGDPAKGFESKALERAAQTWRGRWWEAGGGGTAWEGVAYDSELDLLYFGTGNPTAWYRSLRGGGDNLYTASILAVRASDGEVVWHFQTTPGDNWDYDATQPLVQAELRIDGRLRKVIMQANKNGYFYVLDRATGEFLSGAPFVGGINWATGLDSRTGRPIESGLANAGTNAFIASPADAGAHNWQPMAFSPATGLAYFAAKEGTYLVHAPDPNWRYNANDWNVGWVPMYDGPLGAAANELPAPTGRLVAWDPARQREEWRATYPVTEGGGVLATAGNLVFQGRADGTLAAFRATDGKLLWSFDAGTGIMAPPITYTIDGVQYVSVLAGWGGASGLFNDPNGGPVRPGYGRLLTFALDGMAKLNPPPYGHPGPPPMPEVVADPSPQVIHQGELLYSDHCLACHGTNAVSGPVPDLRYASKETLEGIESIVLGGARADAGMPSFRKVLDAGQVHAIQAYIVARARESAQQSKSRPDDASPEPPAPQ